MTYNLEQNAKSGSKNFYSTLSDFTMQWLQLELPQKEPLLQQILLNRKFIPDASQPTIEEAYIEFLMLGIFINNYGGKAEQSYKVSLIILRKLWKIRNTYPRLKKFTDRLREILIYFLLEHEESTKEPDIKTLGKLIAWLEATGEFDNEAKYLKLWETYLRSLPANKANSILNIARLSAASFSEMAERVFGEYTIGLSAFLKAQALSYKFNEDYIFTARSASEYYLNMFGAEVMNRVDYNQFQQTSHKVMLLPVCMRIKEETQLKTGA